MLFKSVAIPQGATIYEAHLTMHCGTGLGENGTTCRTHISAYDADTGVAVTSQSDFDAKLAANTSAEVSWDDIEAWTQGNDYDSPDISSIIQEIVDRSGWASGNDILIFWEDLDGRSSSGARRSASSYDKVAGEAPKLVVTLSLESASESPSVTTLAASDIAGNTATGNGQVDSLGNPAATQYGHCWASHSNPSLSDDYTENGVPSATGAFTSAITGLEQNVLYYCKAYITNKVGTFYGHERTFTTLAGIPVVTTNLVESVAVSTALGKGSIDNNGGSAITQHGVCWGTSSNPTISDDKTEEGATGVLGNFSSLMTGLSANTTYHVRAYATNENGTGYGADRTFSTFIVGTPIVTTLATINIQATSATGKGEIVESGQTTITQHGHCWDTSANPTTSDSGSGYWGKTSNGVGSIGSFISFITDLTQGSTYYIRAYATNTQGTSYGNNDVINDVAGEIKGKLAILGEYLAYSTKSGIQRLLKGVPF